jgi:hypothetical protein
VGEVVFVDGSVGWASGSTGVWVTEDSGRTWLAATGLPGTFLFGVMAPASSSAAWVQGVNLNGGLNAANGWTLFRTADAGLRWTRVPPPTLA